MTESFQQGTALPVALGGVLALAAAWDLSTARLPNWLTLSAAAGAVAWHAAAGGWQGMLLSVGGWAGGIGLLLLPWLLGGLGAGDAKLMGAVGAFLGPRGCFTAFLATALVGFVAAVSLLAWHGSLGATCSRWLGMIVPGVCSVPGAKNAEAGVRAPRLRYGLVIALGTMGAYLLRERLPGPLSLSPPF